MQKVPDKRLAHLRRDPVLREIIRKLPEVHHAWDMRRRRDHFYALVRAIVNQQLSGKAADTILGRFRSLFPGKKFPTPEDVLKMPASRMRRTGLSRMKVLFLKDLARHISKGSVDFKKMRGMTDEEVIEHLVRVKGIGRWSAEMFLMFSLGRPDIFSYGDLGLRNAMRNLYKMKKHPTPKQAEKISAAWSPYRTLASRYLWASIDLLPKEKKHNKKIK